MARETVVQKYSARSMRVRISGFAQAVLFLIWFAAAFAFGCAPTPHIYTMQPSALEGVRSKITTVGVYISPELAETEVRLPAKGWLGGTKRGIVMGATLPVMIGLVSPVPGGTALGVLVAPLGALVGGVYGAVTALPVEEVEHTEIELAIATGKSPQKNHRQRLTDHLIELGNARTGLRFVAWPIPHPEANRKDTGNQSYTSSDVIDTRLEIRAEKAGLRGMYSINPPTDAFVQIRARLIRMKDDTILIDERIVCASDEERIFKDWAADGGIHLVKEFEICALELAEKVVDDFFRVYPMEWSYDDR
jgi:hypothetical protein